MTAQLDIFVSSKMHELKAERDALSELLPSLNFGDMRLHAWIFEEDAPASGKSIRAVYLKALQNAALYIGLFWNEYGEYTIDEFELATECGLERHLYVKDVEANRRDPKLQAFLDKYNDVKSGITAKWFKTLDELKEAVKKSIQTWITEGLRARASSTEALFIKDPDDVPEHPRRLFGRDEILREVTNLLTANERVLLQGFGGMGKTALAAEVVHEWIRDGKGMAIWLKCGSADTETLLQALARPFGSTQAIARESGEAKLQLARQLLRESGAKLLALDDCWHGGTLRTLLKIVPSDMPVLVTARQRYPIEGQIRQVGELHPDDALALLGYHAGQSFSIGSEGAASEINPAANLCKTLGYHAFAIEIAAKNLKANRWTPAELLAKIKDTPHQLSLPLEFNQAGRENVARLIEVSLNALNKETRRAFLSFGAFFAPSATPELLGLFLDSATQDVDAAFATLEQNGLAERIPATESAMTHYQVHDLAYSYARSQTTDEQRIEALKASLAYLSRYAEPSLANFTALRPVLENLLAGATQAALTGYYGQVIHFADILFGASSGILFMQGFFAQAIPLLKQTAEAAGEIGNLEQREIYLRRIALTYMSLGQYRESLEYAQQSLALARQSGNQGAEAKVLGNLGNINYRMGNINQALEYIQLALALSRQLGDKVVEARQLGNLGNIHSDLQQHQLAIDYLQQAQVIFNELGDRMATGMILGNLGLAYGNSGQPQTAIDYYEQALAIQCEIGDRNGQGNQLGNLGFTYLQLKQYDRALDYMQQSMIIMREIGDRRGEGIGLDNLGKIYLELEQHEQALDFLQQSLAIQREIGYRLGEAETLSDLGEVHRRLGQYQKARDYFQESRNTYEAVGVQAEVERIDQLVASLSAGSSS